MRLARHYLVSGRVHGVGFRVFTQDVAAREGVHGWVANTSDGRVEIHAEGEAEALERFERGIAQGPPMARVENLDVTNVAPEGRETGFIVRSGQFPRGA